MTLQKKRTVIFSGHMIDRPDREQPRFPPLLEPLAARAILDAVAKTALESDDDIIGIAGGACGGDILFHEACLHLKIRSVMFLALPPEKFASESVVFAGQHWVDRFYRLCGELPTLIYDRNADDPEQITREMFWERTNDWMLNTALAMASNSSLLAFWDQREPDGSGGTKHMVEEMRSVGRQVVILDPTLL